MAGMDVQAFLTGFLGESARQITKRKEKAEEEIDYFKRNRDQFIQAAEQRKQLRANAGTLANRLKDYNVSDDMLAAAAAEGPTGLTDLHRTLQDASRKHGLDFVKDNIGLYVDASVDKAALGEDFDINTILDQAYGIGSYESGDYKPTQEYGFFGKLFGKNAMDTAYAELDKEPVWDGMSLYDLRQFAQNKAYADVGGDSYIQYKSPLVFSADDVNSELLEISRIKNTVEEQEDYVAAEATIKQAQKDIQKYRNADGTAKEGFEQQLQDAENSLETALATKDRLLSQFLDPYLQGKIDTYAADTYMKRMSTAIDSIFGVTDYVSKFSMTDEDTAAPAAPAVAPDGGLMSSRLDEKGKGPEQSTEPVYSDDPVIAKLQKSISNPYIKFKVTEDGLQLIYEGKDGTKEYSVGQTKAFFEKNKDSLGDLTYESVFKALDTEGVAKHGLSFLEKGFTVGANEMGVPDITVEKGDTEEEKQEKEEGLSWWQKGFTIGANEPTIEDEGTEPTEEDKPATMDITKGPVVEEMTRENAPADIKADYKEYLEDNDLEDTPESFKQFIEDELPIVEG